jgi:TM2 domain-containing membrane protein YozV
MKSKTAAALLAFFLGGIGAHKFYLGQTGAGIVYLLFCWTFIPALIAFFEFIGFLVMSEANFNARYNAPFVHAAAPTMQQAQNITVNIPSMMPGQNAPQSYDSVGQLSELNKLRISGALTEEEYQTQKQKILSR